MSEQLLSKEEEQALNNWHNKMRLGTILRRLVNNIEAVQALADKLDADTGVRDNDFRESVDSTLDK